MTTTWIVTSLIVLVSAVVLAVTFLRACGGHDGNGGAAALAEAQEQQRRLRPLARDLKARRAKNNFAPLIEKALRGGS